MVASADRTQHTAAFAAYRLNTLQEFDMPLVRINLSSNASAEVVRGVSDAVYDAMIQVASVPQHDRFQIVTRHAPDELIYPAEGYLGISYTPGIVFIQVTWNAGRTIDVKKAFYRAVADGVHAKAGLRKEDVWISLVDVKREDWSFGNGEMQYAPKE
jgi:4-oxalocrotonate tautomerase